MPLLETVKEAYKCHRIKNNFQKELSRLFYVYFGERFLAIERKSDYTNALAIAEGKILDEEKFIYQYMHL